MGPPKQKQPKPLRRQRTQRVGWLLFVIASPPAIIFLSVVAAREWGTKDNWLSAIVCAVVAGGLLWRLIVLMRRRPRSRITRPPK